MSLMKFPEGQLKNRHGTYWKSEHKDEKHQNFLPSKSRPPKRKIVSSTWTGVLSILSTGIMPLTPFDSSVHSRFVGSNKFKRSKFSGKNEISSSFKKKATWRPCGNLSHEIRRRQKFWHLMRSWPGQMTALALLQNYLSQTMSAISMPEWYSWLIRITAWQKPDATSARTS